MLSIIAVSIFTWLRVVAAADFFYKGHDLSSLRVSEVSGTTYYDGAKGGQQRAAEDILADGGMNTVRLRLWVNPRDSGNQGDAYGTAYTLDLAKRFHAKGQRIYLDFHFSDTWADPGKQGIPRKWPKELDPLASTLRKYVASTLGHFKAAGVPIAIVALGNEIRPGMLWPVGKANPGQNGSFKNLSVLWKAAREGVSDAVAAGLKKPEVMIHIDNGWDSQLQQNWFAGLTASGVVTTKDWDVIGLSFYPFYNTRATFANLATSMRNLATKYNKPIHVAETDYPAECTGKYKAKPQMSEPSIPSNVGGQTQWVQKTIQTVKAVPNGLGQGIFYWEPTWTNNTGLGSACEDAILFASKWSGSKAAATSRTSVNMFK
ncbi:glycoside hydrolase family 53 protein [Microthyrium microscopicum]|uniref:Arabinogalactan endo-beta-1,4-galactanase n=1 Tax=Microthyrium microscopicum TaxID=703497 RepID=A0A6A6TXF7_9PEZI|nr:glycoside hydrolase family 53 protein [Microthyrium microscopicum]